MPDDHVITHVLLPGPGGTISASDGVRLRQSHDWPLALASVNLVMDSHSGGIGRRMNCPGPETRR